MSACPTCGNELRDGDCPHCEPTAPQVASEKRTSSITLHLDEKTENSAFFKTLSRLLGFQPFPGEEGKGKHWRKNIPDETVSQATLNNLKDILAKQVQTLRTSHDRLQEEVKGTDDLRAKVQEEQRKAEKQKSSFLGKLLGKKSGDPGKLETMMKELEARERYPGKVEQLKNKIQDLTDVQYFLTSMEEDGSFAKDREESWASVGPLLENAVTIVAEAEELIKDST